MNNFPQQSHVVAPGAEFYLSLKTIMYISDYAIECLISLKLMGFQGTWR